MCIRDRVLMADDDPIICESACEILNELGMRSSWVLSGREAVSRVVAAHEAADDFFAVILDWMMPGMDGLETLRLIRQKVGPDVPITRESAVELLAMHGLLADTAENGQIAVERFQASAPGEYACILMDIQMPVMDGYQASEAIRRLEREDARAIPILALTANAFAADVGRAHSAGMNDHISKPIDVDQLIGAIQLWTNNKRKQK